VGKLLWVILQTCLLDRAGPAVYVTPNKQLSRQAEKEAAELGIPTVDDPRSPDFLQNKAILVTNIYKLVNGMSVFGVSGDNRSHIEIGALVFDDAHASLETIEGQFSITIPRQKDGPFDAVVEIFSDDLDHQNPSRFMEIQEGAPNRSMLVPYWAWQKRQSQILRVLHEYKDSDFLKFSWPLVIESLPRSSCVVTSDRIEITPQCVPIDKIPSVANAKRRILMSATLADDSVLSTHLGISELAISDPLVPRSAGDVGDRMFFTPSLICPREDRDETKAMLKRLSNDHNVVVIVPSQAKAKFWSDVAIDILVGDDVDAGIEKLRAGHVGLIVLINRYDGIDLPDNACRVLVLDGLPDARRQIEIIKQGYLRGSDRVKAQISQRIEQGAGRGIRSTQDYCAVVLMGSDLCTHVHTKGVRERFSPATRAQFELSDQIVGQLSSHQDIEEVVRSEFLNRKSQWPAASRQAVASLTYEVPRPSQLAMAMRSAFDRATCADLAGAENVLQKALTGLDDQIETGFAKQILAEYVNTSDEIRAQEIQLSAKRDNTSVLSPISGFSFVNRSCMKSAQAEKILSNFSKRSTSGPKLLLEAKNILDGLAFDPLRTNLFEESVRQLGLMIGLGAQRPELETDKGPDVLWGIGGTEYLIIECKSGATTETIKKRDAGQLNTSAAWFEAEFDPSCIGHPVMIHLSRSLARDSALRDGSRVWTFAKFDETKTNFWNFCEWMGSNFGTLDPSSVSKALSHHKLQGQDFLPNYTSLPKTT